MRKLTLWLISSLLLSFSVFAQQGTYSTQHPAYELDGKAVLGRLENVYFIGNEKYKDIPFEGKIDTGADTTSVHADNIHVYSTNPKYSQWSDDALLKKVVDEFGGSASNWWLKEFDTPERNLALNVRFTVTSPYSGEVVAFEKPLARVSVVRSRTSEEPLYRPVINLQMKIGEVEAETEASLTNRENFSSPVLIGKTFLREQAWVFAGYDYLQEQQDATLIGKEEAMLVNGAPMTVSISLSSSLSILHATNIRVDDNKRQVQFDTKDNQGAVHSFTLPLVRMISFGDTKRPEVSVPVKGGEHFEKRLAVYLKDRSEFSSQLRLGTDALSRHFVVSASEKNRLERPKQGYADFIAKQQPLIVSPEERILVDGISIDAKPNLRVQTPVLKVSSFEISSGDKEEQVTYYLNDEQQALVKFTKPILRKIKVGKSVRPVVLMRLEADGRYAEYEVALEQLSKGESAVFLIGQKAKSGGVLINTRTTLLLESHSLVKAGYIENATVEGMVFPAKLDTGADVSSMHAEAIRLYRHEGQDMVDFTYQNDQGTKQQFTKKVERMMTIKAKDGEEPNHRPVVLMEVEIGGIKEKIEVNLQDRSRFAYSMILGKNFLRHGVVVSSDSTFLLGGAEKE